MTSTRINPRPSTPSIKSDRVARHFLPEKKSNMNLPTLMKMMFANALSRSAASQVEIHEPRVVGAHYASETAKHADA
jgi:hypothetical protein